MALSVKNIALRRKEVVGSPFRVFDKFPATESVGDLSYQQTFARQRIRQGISALI